MIYLRNHTAFEACFLSFHTPQLLSSLKLSVRGNWAVFECLLTIPVEQLLSANDRPQISSHCICISPEAIFGVYSVSVYATLSVS